MKIRVYILLLISLFLIFFIYIDYRYFFNIKKYSVVLCDADVDLVDYDTIKSRFVFENQLKSQFKVAKGKSYLVLNGFDDLELNFNNRKLLKRNSIHQTQLMALFSLSYLTEFIQIKIKENGKIDNADMKRINEVYSFVSSEFLNPFSINNMTYNDHVVSERIQFDILYLSYLTHFQKNETEMMNDLNKDLKICANFLLDDKQFNAFTNHGLMQLRAMALLADCSDNKTLNTILVNKLNERLSDLLPYFIGDDGAIYEAASGYWIFIYKQFSMLAGHESIKKTDAYSELLNRLKLSNNFITTIATNDGFLQGMGDSYNNTIDFVSETKQDNYDKYLFSNNLAGYKFKQNNIEVNALFVSLNTPPNVHKLPEDLAIYIYAGAAYFINTGIYSYDNSDTRRFFMTEDSQPTVKFRNKPAQKYHSVIESEKGCFLGRKIYHSGDTIYRLFKLQSAGFESVDYSSSNEEILSSFIIDPEVKMNKMNDSTFVLRNTKGVDMLIESSVSFRLKTTYISNLYNKLIPAQRVEFFGKTIKLKFTVSPNIKLSDNYINKECKTKIESSRKLSYNKFFTKYGVTIKDITNFKQDFIKSLLCINFLTFVLFSLLIYVSKKKYNQNC